MASKIAILTERVERTILLIRGQKVMLDADLAALYGVATKAMNQAIKRNADRFPREFMFQLTKKEKDEVVTVCDHLSRLKYSAKLPFALTEHGVLMAATILNSSRAIEMSVGIIKTFVRLREMLASNADLSRKLVALERKYDNQFRVVFDAIRESMAPEPEEMKPRIGYQTEEERRRAKR